MFQSGLRVNHIADGSAVPEAAFVSYQYYSEPLASM